VSWSRPFGSRGHACAIAAAVGLFAVAFAIEVAIRPGDFITHSDVPLYQEYGSQIADGRAPYRDFDVEYPPAALPMFALPATKAVAWGSTEQARWDPENASARRYHRGFAVLVFLLGAATIVLTGLSLAALRRPAGGVLLSLAVVALAPLLIGDVYADRFDVWPAALSAAALAAAVRDRFWIAGAALGLAAAAKIYPALLVPVLVIFALRRRGARQAVLTAASPAAVVALVFLPFAILSLSGAWRAVRIQFEGGLQIESLGSAVLVLASRASGSFTLTDRAAEHGLSRGVLIGPGVHPTEIVLDVALGLALVLLWWSALRSASDSRDELVRYSAAVVATAVALGSVLSPQYVIWLIPLVPLVGGRRGVAATLVLALAATLTHLWFPWGYFKYASGLDVDHTMLLLARNLALLATAAIVALPAGASGRRRPRPAGAALVS
jgi:Glycosyltransferase family 87